MQQNFKIEFRKKQLYEDNNLTKPIVVNCDSSGNPEYLPGLIPLNDWVDVTENVEGLKDLRFSWTAQQEISNDADGSNEFGSNYSKGLSAELRFFDSAFHFIYGWLMSNPCQMLNAVEVKITDLLCGKSYRVFELKLDNTQYSPEEPCLVTMPLREMDDVIHSFQKTIIEDNWQNWFNKDGTSTKEHPTFGIVVEKKPKFYLAIFAVLIYIVGILSAGIITKTAGGKRWIRRTLGFCYFGPAPLIRTYIENICLKFGYTFNTLFDDKPENPYRDLTLFWPASATYKNFEGFDSPSTKFIWDNRTVLSFSTFLNQLKKVFNAEWYVTPNRQLVFQNRAYFDNQPPLYDFTAEGADMLHGLKYTFNGKKKPAYGDYQYLLDPQDTCSNEVKWRYNDIVDYDGPANNPMLEGKVTKTFDFAMTAFHNDGSAEDFIEEAVKIGRVIAAGAIILGMGRLFTASNPLTVLAVIGLLTIGYLVTNAYVNNFFNNADLNGMVRASNSELNQPRLLLWDRTSPLNRAKVVSVVAPAINPYYNKEGLSYYEEHPTHDEPGLFGSDIMNIYNYPCYVDALFLNNLYDRFHEYDNPLRNPVINQDFEGTVDLCCEWLDRVGVWENTYIKVGSVLILENRQGRKIKGRLTDVEPDYKTGQITLKGKVLK